MNTNRNQVMNARISLLFTCIFSLFFIIFSCKDDDSTPPELSLTSPNLNDTVRNEVEIKFDATDNDAISYVEIYANDSLIGKVTHPLKSLKWNTLIINDGTYSIKCRAFDKNGNFKEDERTVVVENALVKIDMGELYQDQYNILITDSSGNILSNSSFKSNDQYIIKPKNTFDKNSINLFYYLTNGNYRYIKGYLNIKRGFTLSMGNKTKTTYSFVTVHIRKTNLLFSQLTLTTDRGNRQLNTLADTISGTPLAYSPEHGLLVQITKPEGIFYKYFQINNPHLVIDLSEVNILSEKKTINLPPDHKGSCFLRGILKPDDKINQYFLSYQIGSTSENKVDVYYPGNVFSKIISSVICGNNSIPNAYYANEIKGDIPSTFEPLEVTHQVIRPNANNFKMILNGDADFYSLNYRLPNNEDLYIYSTANITEFKFPDLATIYSDPKLNIAEYVLKNVGIYKINDMPQSKFMNFYFNNYPDPPWNKSQYKSTSY